MHYKLSFQKPHQHFVQFQFEFVAHSDNPILSLPLWRPGRYEIQNYVAGLTQFQLENPQHNWRKRSSHEWELNVDKGTVVRGSYAYYCNKADAGSSYLDAHFLYINPVNCFLYLEDQSQEPYEVSLAIPDSFSVHWPLPMVEGKYIANTFYHLADTPFFAGDRLNTWSAALPELKLLCCLEGEGNISFSKIGSDLCSIAQAAFQIFQVYPEKEYTFFVWLYHEHFYHGVEHRNNTVMVLGKAKGSFPESDEELYDSFLGLAAHEFFHAWNIAKIRPQELIPYQYNRALYFDTCFVAEGFTTYYGDLLLARSGIWPQERYLQELADTIRLQAENTGKYYATLSQSSIDLWSDGYQASAPYRKVSVYHAGACLALLLDLHIRKLSDQKSSLDDFMRLLWSHYGTTEKGYTMERLYALAAELGGNSWADLMLQGVQKPQNFENLIAQILPSVGLMLIAQTEATHWKHTFGFKYSIYQNIGKITAIAPGSPADLFLSIGDEFVEIDKETPQEFLNKTQYNNAFLVLQVKRRNRFEEICLVANSQKYFPNFQIVPLEDASDAEIQARKLWLFGS